MKYKQIFFFRYKGVGGTDYGENFQKESTIAAVKMEKRYCSYYRKSTYCVYLLFNKYIYN